MAHIRGGNWIGVVVLCVTACGVAAGPDAEVESDRAQGEQTWLEASDDHLEVVLARQLRGLDIAMIEIDHRFVELYFAGQDGNWGYAEHQVEHMELALDLALERRPHRATSARGHFMPHLRRMQAVVEAGDAAAFPAAFESLLHGCNACHRAEDEPSFVVGLPTQRRTSIGAG
jgi:hypothetical protein